VYVFKMCDSATRPIHRAYQHAIIRMQWN